MKKYGMTIIIFSGIVTLLSLLGVIFTFLWKDALVVSLTLQGYRMIRNVSLAIFLLFMALFLFYFSAVFIANQRDRIENNKKKEEAVHKASLILEQKKENEAFLNSRGNLVETILREKLQENSNGEWHILKNEIEALYQQSVEMDTLQEKLGILLKTNDATRLNDAEEVLEKAEQGLLRNIRKPLNYMEAGSTTDTKSIAKVRESLMTCHETNANILSDARDFLMAMTEYLNGQGDKDNGMESLLSYKEILLASVKEKEKV